MNQAIPWPGWSPVRNPGGYICEIRRKVPGGIEAASMLSVHIPADPGETRRLQQMGLSPEQIRAKYKNDLDILTRKFRCFSELRDTPGLVRCQALSPQPDGMGWVVFLRTEPLAPLPPELSPDRANQALQQLCRGVTALRQTLRGPLDLRNVFVAADGGFRLGDFSVLPENGDFAPPEIQPPRVPGPEGDSYALGMVLYRMLNRGRAPADPGAPLPEPAAGSPQLKAVAQTACHPDPRQRYASPQALLEALASASPCPAAAPKKKGTGKIIVPAALLSAVLILGGILWVLSRVLPGSDRIPGHFRETEAVELPVVTEAVPVSTEPAETAASETVAPETAAPETEPAVSFFPPTRSVIAAGKFHTVLLMPDGTAAAAGSNGWGQCNVGSWTGLTSVYAGDKYTLGLLENGTAVAAGDNAYGQCSVGGWTDLVCVSAGDYHCAGLRADGSLVATGFNNRGQTDMAALQQAVGGRTVCQVVCGYECTLALCTDGTVAAIGSNDYGQCNVDGWTDIVALWAGTDHTVGLRADGTVVAAGRDDYGQCLVGGWENIVSVTAGDYFTVGVTGDGSLVFTGQNKRGQLSELGGWDRILAVGGGCQHTVAIRSDGAILTSGWNEDGQCELPGVYPLS